MSMQGQLADDDGLSAQMTLRQMLTGGWLTQAVYVVAKLGVADHLKDGRQTAKQLSARLQVDASALYRVMRTLASYGLFEEDDDGGFRLTPLGSQLQTAVPGSMRALAIWNGEVPYKAWGSVLHTMKTGRPATPHVLGMRLFDYLSEDREAGRIFDEAMTGLCRQVAQAVVSAYDFSGIEHLVDVGGGQGILIASIASRYPQMQGVLFDRPSVVEETTRVFRAMNVSERCRVVVGDFFESVYEGADAYILSSVIHDWDDEHALRILRNCRRAMKPEGKLLLVECVIRDSGEPLFSKLIDLQMLVVTGGCERTQSQFESLLAAAGFRLNRVVQTAVPECVIEAVPLQAASPGRLRSEADE
jgi:ubiquinone/menaquinone biosynthesis C-methylase UbiE